MIKIIEADKFIGELVRIGGSIMVTIPAKHVKFTGVKEGDFVKVWFRKAEKGE